VAVYGRSVVRSDKLAIEELEALRVPLTGFVTGFWDPRRTPTTRFRRP
jgi:hypothetical protein